MTRKVSDQNRRDAEILQTVMTLIKDNGGQMRYADIVDEMPKVFSFRPNELEPTKTREHGWHSVLQMVGGIELKSAGLVDRTKGIWSITDAGVNALKLSYEEFYKLYHYRWLDIQKAKRTLYNHNKDTENITKTESEPETIDEIAVDDIEIIQQNARDRIRKHIANKNPYEFQNLVAALFRAMGYFTPFVAPPGRDGGIDIIAYCDPLGIKKPHIKLQVKHYPTSSISVDVVRSLGGILKEVDEIGFVVTSGTFTKEAQRESRQSHRYVRLIDGDELIDLWIAYYKNMSEEDKALLPIVPVYYLDNNK